MGRIFCLIGKSSTGKDTIYKELLTSKSLDLKKIVPYTTRPIREGEEEGVEYHFTTVEGMKRLKEENKVIESRYYDTIHGLWYYFTAKDSQINLEENNYLVIGTLESYVMTRDYFGEDKVVPIYIELEDGERLDRALQRERKQKQPMYQELCRRFLADTRDFSKEKLDEAGITKYFNNYNLKKCLKEITEYIKSFR